MYRPPTQQGFTRLLNPWWICGRMINTGTRRTNTTHVSGYMRPGSLSGCWTRRKENCSWVSGPATRNPVRRRPLKRRASKSMRTFAAVSVETALRWSRLLSWELSCVKTWSQGCRRHKSFFGLDSPRVPPAIRTLWYLFRDGWHTEQHLQRLRMRSRWSKT